MNMHDPSIQSKPHILLVNLGTPSEPTRSGVRRYLREFLSDPRVVDLPRWQWLPILNLIILPFRSGPVAGKYRLIWDKAGSPLAVFTERLASLIGEMHPEWEVASAMRYGSPAMKSVLQSWIAAGVRDIRVLPLYPQYSVTTVASVQDVVDEIAPEATVLAPYFAHTDWLDAVASRIRSYWDEHGRGEHLVFSFHGIPQRFADNGDPYPEQNEFTAMEIARRLELPRDQWTMAYQSRFGREPWLLPATEPSIRTLVAEGTPQVDVVAPGFAVDCLETLEEVAMGIAERAHEIGGQVRYIPCLNDSREHARALSTWIGRHG